jgi:CHAT domain-containing protein/tetratricopeptide (TPR) repeat protein
MFRRRLVTRGTSPAQTTIALTPEHEWLIEAREQGNDAVVELKDAPGHLLARADHPERRTGTRRIIIRPVDSGLFTVQVVGKEHQAVSGTVEIVAFDLAVLSMDATCLGAYRALAAGDAEYAMGQAISLGWSTGEAQTVQTGKTAHDAYQRAAEEYGAAEALLEIPGAAKPKGASGLGGAAKRSDDVVPGGVVGLGGDVELRAEAALALAGVRYFDLQEWRESAKWASSSAELYAHRDPYRQARAQALAAAAWMEMATDSTRDTGARLGGEGDRKVMLSRARRTLRHLFSFHSQRGEGYDAALQINNIGLSFMYEGRFSECVAAAGAASRLFGRLNEAPRRGLAWQNSAVCHWGLGHLPQALEAFNRALEDLRPEPYPNLYLLALNNTALMNYALGHFDESLRLHDRALTLAVRSQNRRAEAQSLYGIGVTYYALGDLSQAREFLERALAIRTAAFNGRGRQATLRSLATVYADVGEYDHAMAFDREAVDLATAPSSRMLSGIQLSVHTALAAKPREALGMLADLLGAGGVPDPLLRAQARIARAAIERRGGDTAAALDDLGAAIRTLRRVGGVTDGFSADLELARVLDLAGKETAALAAVDRALERSEAIRTQTSNPEFRAQLQIPLRAAYDLKLDLLWKKFDRAAKAGELKKARRIAAVAFHTADAARARSFADIAAQRYSAGMRRDLAGDFARRAKLYQNLAGLRFALDARLDGDGSRDPRARALASEIAGVQREVDTLNSTLAARSAMEGAGAVMPAGGGAAIRAGGAESLSADTAIIAYWLGSESAYAWTVTRGEIHWARLNTSGAITAAARAFHDSLTRLTDIPRERRIDTGAALYAEIIRPVESWITPYRRWVFIPDAALNYVPFGALRTNSRESAYVVMGHDVALAPAAWMLFTPRAERPRAQHGAASSGAGILIVSDPVYELSDPRVSLGRGADRASLSKTLEPVAGAEPSYRRIPGTAREAAAIAAVFPAAEVDALTGFQATREQLLRLDWSRYRFIHVASHGYVDARIPQLSALVLSAYDQRGERIEAALRSADLFTLTLSADLAVFSGCDTALGKEVQNEGMVGIAYATLARGARAVVSSLWAVPDEMGASLMTELYRHLVSDSMSPTAALSSSMRSVLRRNPAADPALWAAFQVSVMTIGNTTEDYR